MIWLLTAHVRRYHQHYHSSGHVWQGRFKVFAIQEDDHLRAVLRYVERNPVRAGPGGVCGEMALVQRRSECAGTPPLDAGPVPLPRDWLDDVNLPQTAAEVERLRECVRRGRPYGDTVWRAADSTALRHRGELASARPTPQSPRRRSNAVLR